MGLKQDMSLPAAHLTTAQRRLLEIARASVGEPRVILLDETGAGLASTESRELRAIISQLAHRTGALIILIDHDVELVRSVCSTLAVLDFGRLIASGETATVIDNPVVRSAYLGEQIAT